MKKVFVGGYYVEDLKIWSDEKGLAYTEILRLSLEDALKHPAIENVEAYYYERPLQIGEMQPMTPWENLSDDKKIREIEKYIQDDEIFGGWFLGPAEAEELIKELEENAKNYED